MSGLTVLAPGTVFAGSYRVEKPLKEGGMGAVYVATQIGTSQRCALKVMQPELVKDAEARKRFEREAKAGGQLQSDFVVKVLDARVDETTGMPWLAMELLAGKDLEDHVNEKGHLTPGELLEVFDPLCEALGEAHGKGIVHRDLKPENIFLARPRRKRDPFTLKVLDFGFARLTAESQTTSSKTRKILGTPLFMAPEQARPGTPIEPATDVWALGLMAFRLLTGRHFWRAAYDDNATLMMLMMEAYVHPMPPASERAAEWGCTDRLPPTFDDWFAKCTDRNAAGRYENAAVAFAALRGWRPPRNRTRPERPRRPRLPCRFPHGLPDLCLDSHLRGHEGRHGHGAGHGHGPHGPAFAARSRAVSAIQKAGSLHGHRRRARHRGRRGRSGHARERGWLALLPRLHPRLPQRPSHPTPAVAPKAW